MKNNKLRALLHFLMGFLPITARTCLNIYHGSEKMPTSWQMGVYFFIGLLSFAALQGITNLIAYVDNSAAAPPSPLPPAPPSVTVTTTGAPTLPPSGPPDHRGDATGFQQP